MRWIYHLLARETPVGEHYAPASLATEGFMHGSFRDAVAESARLYFAPGQAVDVLQIDPRRLSRAPILADTPRGPMPHLPSALPADAIRARVAMTATATGGASTSANAIDALPDRVTGTRIAIVAFDDLTLLDLVGVLDPLARIASMGFDPATTVEVVGAYRPAAWRATGATVTVDRIRPDLADFDLVIVPGGPGARALAADPAARAWLGGYPSNRMIASVCTGALVLGALGRLRGHRATTHASALADLAAHGAIATPARVVDDGSVITAAGVTAAIDLGLHLVERLLDAATADRMAAQMEWPLRAAPR